MIGVILMTSKYFILMSVSIVLMSSCSSVMNNFAPTDSFVSIKNYITGFPQPHISQEDYNKYDSSFAVIRFGRGPVSIMSLAYARNGIYEWRSNDGIKIYTQNGIIIKTDGLIHDMEFAPTCFDSNLLNLPSIQSCKVSLYNPDLNQAYSTFTISAKPDTSVLRFEKKIPVSELKAKIDIPSIRWSKENTFYLDQNVVLSAIQYIHPRLAPVYIEYYLVY